MDVRKKNLATMTTLVRIPFNLFFGKIFFKSNRSRGVTGLTSVNN